MTFNGTPESQAKASQTTTGARSWFLKIADLFFMGNVGSEVPITIKAKRDDPDFGIDVGRALTP